MTSLIGTGSAAISRPWLPRWLDAMPHPAAVCEIAATHVAAANWGGGKLALEGHAVEELKAGSVNPSAVESNVAQPESVSGVAARVFGQAGIGGPEVALVVPDQVVRVFVLPFETLPRRYEEALPLIRFRLKKSVPFDIEEASVSFSRQPGRIKGIEVVAAVAKQRIVQEYEQALQASGMEPGVVLSATLAALPLVDVTGATLLARMAGSSLTTVIVQGEVLAAYRCTDMGTTANALDARTFLEEVFPSVAYFQDTWGGTLDRVRLAGIGGRFQEFAGSLGQELECPVRPLEIPEGQGGARDVQRLVDESHDALVGWALNHGA